MTDAVEAGEVTLVDIDAASPLVRTLFDRYCADLRPHQPPEWAQAEPVDGHMPWPALLGPGAEDGLTLQAIHVAGTGALAGFVTTHVYPLGLEIRDLYIQPEWRQSGYGRAVVDHFKALCPRGIICDVLRSNEAAQWFWTKMGFERIGTSNRWGPEARDYVQVLVWPRGAFHIGASI